MTVILWYGAVAIVLFWFTSWLLWDGRKGLTLLDWLELALTCALWPVGWYWQYRQGRKEGIW